ncbi:thiazolylpeptide-type bacteriocin [Kitasatospora camelliae]|uniref:Thiazolylpeptide-type bacteriocin n=1 Tax=Kitasatospora camelliae TaxID=3156397 RepID=A0AAU8K544_9ACTN
MSDTPNDPDLALQDLDLDELTVTSLRDTAALPETGASWGSCSCQASSSCQQPQVMDPVLG